MDTPFDAIKYFHDMAAKNKVAVANKFFPCKCSGIGTLEEVLGNLQTQKAFICVEDTDDSATSCINGGWFKHRAITVFIMHRYTFGDMADREDKLRLCRQIFHQFHSRMIRDRELCFNDGLHYLDVEKVASHEFGEYFVGGLTGLYFVVELMEPINLCYDEKQWTE